MTDFIEDYLQSLKSEISRLDKGSIQQAAGLLFSAYLSNRQVFIIGNGGSASTASHFACDLSKGTIVEGKCRIRVTCLNDNTAILTAISNDFGYEHVFSEQLKNLAGNGDVLVAISASGNSANIINGIRLAQDKGVKVIGFTGFDGGMLKQLSDLCVHVGSYNYGQVEDIHLFLCHVISQNLRQKILEA